MSGVPTRPAAWGVYALAPMASVLVTVVGPQRRTDLTVPADTPILELIPEIVDLCIDAGARSPSARWAVGKVGDEPLTATETLADHGIIDGALIYVRDMTSSTPPPVAEPRPSQNPAQPTAARRAPGPAAPRGRVSPSASSSSSAPAHAAIARDGEGRPLGATAAVGSEATGLQKAYELTTSGLVVSAVLLTVVLVGMIVLGVNNSFTGTALLADVVILAAVTYVVWNYGIVATMGKRRNIAWMRNLRLPPRLAAAKSETAVVGTPDAWKQERLDKVTTLAEEFIYDLGRLLAGHNPPLEYVLPPVAVQLRDMATPFLRTGDRMVPNFSDVRLTVQWPKDQRRAIAATAVFLDQSARQTARGQTVNPPPRRVTVELQTDADATRIVEARVASDDGRLA